MSVSIRNTVLYFGLVVTLVYSSVLRAEGPARQTAISKVMVFPIKGDASQQLHIKIAHVLSTRSYLSAVPYKGKEAPSASLIKEVTKGSDVDGVIIGATRKGNLVLEMRTKFGFRPISSWNFPLKSVDLATIKEEQLWKITEDIITSIPYRGFVTEAGKSEVTIAASAGPDLQKGKSLRIFEFSGSSPTFSSPQKYIADIEVQKVEGNQVTAQVVSSTQPIRPFAKVAFESRDLTYTPPAKESTQSSFWMMLGGSSRYLSSSVSQTDAKTSQRLTKLNLTPFYELGLGGSSWRLLLAAGRAENPNQAVTFMAASGSFDLFEHRWGSLEMATGFGVGSKMQEVETNVSPALLTGSQDTYGIINESMSYELSNRAALLALIELHYPYMSSDDQGLKSSLATSFGLLANLGLRLNLGRHLGLEYLVGNDYTNIALDGNGTLKQNSFMMNLRGLYYF